MCTMIASQVKINGCGKGTQGWFDLQAADVSYDHPFHAPYEHALNIDFVNEAQGPGARVAVELSAAEQVCMAAASRAAATRPFSSAAARNVVLPTARKRTSLPASSSGLWYADTPMRSSSGRWASCVFSTREV